MHHYTTHHRPERGFTLLELSVILLIMALLAVGISLGKDVLDSSKNRSLIQEVQEFRTSILTFRTRFQAFPGDMSDATTYLSGVANGDGDELIEWNTGSGTPHEGPQAFLHLQTADLLSSDITLSGQGGTAVINTNIPPSVITGAGYSVNYFTSILSNAENTGHYLLLGGESTTGFNLTPVLGTEDAHTIDNKMDDNRPKTGRVLAQDPGNSTCTANTYDISNSVPACYVLYFKFEGEL